MTFTKLFSSIFSLLLTFFLTHISLQEATQVCLSSCDHAYQQQMLLAVNTKRLVHGAPTVVIQQFGGMIDYSQALAEYYAGQRKDRPEPPEAYGEEWLPYDPAYDNPTSIIYNGLYNETLVSEYRWYGQEPPGRPERRKFSRFTQLVWWSHGPVAFGCADEAANRRILVVTFSPPGNLPGKYAKNVRKPRQMLFQANATGDLAKYRQRGIQTPCD